MNPYTRSLLVELDDPKLEALVMRWDSLKALVISIFREGLATPENETQFHDPRKWLEGHYAALGEALSPHWKAVQIDGQAISEDPFLSLLAPARVVDFVDNWKPMKTL